QPALGDIDESDDGAAAIEVVPGAPVTLAVSAEQVAVEGGRAVQVRAFDGDAEQLRDTHDADPFVTERGPGERQICLVGDGSRSPSHQVTTRWRQSRASR